MCLKIPSGHWCKGHLHWLIVGMNIHSIHAGPLKRGRVFLSKGHFTHETDNPWPSHFKHSHWWKRQSCSKFASHYTWGTNGVYKWMQYGCKVYMDSYMASNGSCVMVTWTIFKNHLLEVGLTQNQETIAFRTLTTVDLFYFIMCEGPHE